MIASDYGTSAWLIRSIQNHIRLIGGPLSRNSNCKKAGLDRSERGGYEPPRRQGRQEEKRSGRDTNKENLLFD